MYFIALVIHILSAIAFVGYLFFDVCILPFARKSVSKESISEVKKAYTKGSAVVLGLDFVLLLVSGTYLASQYIGFEKGFFGSNFQTILSLKIIMLFILIVLTFISVFYVRFLKKPDPFGKYSHIIGLVLSVVIVFLAKAMWYF